MGNRLGSAHAATSRTSSKGHRSYPSGSYTGQGKTLSPFPEAISGAVPRSTATARADLGGVHRQLCGDGALPSRPLHRPTFLDDHPSTDPADTQILAAKAGARNARLTASSLCKDLEQFRISPDERPSATERKQKPANRDLAKKRQNRAKIRQDRMPRPPKGAHVGDAVLQDKLRRASQLEVKYELAKRRLRDALKRVDQAYDELEAALDDIQQHGIEMKKDHEQLVNEADPDAGPSTDRMQMVVQAASRLNAARTYARQVIREMGGSLPVNVRATTSGRSAFTLPSLTRWSGPRFP